VKKTGWARGVGKGIELSGSNPSGGGL